METLMATRLVGFDENPIFEQSRWANNHSVGAMGQIVGVALARVPPIPFEGPRTLATAQHKFLVKMASDAGRLCFIEVVDAVAIGSFVGIAPFSGDVSLYPVPRIRFSSKATGGNRDLICSQDEYVNEMLSLSASRNSSQGPPFLRDSCRLPCVVVG